MFNICPRREKAKMPSRVNPVFLHNENEYAIEKYVCLTHLEKKLELIFVGFIIFSASLRDEGIKNSFVP